MRTLVRFALLASCCAILASPPVKGQTALASQQRAYRVGYVMFGVASIQKSIDFYHDKLGLKLTRQAPDVAFFDAGTISIAVSPEVGREPGESEVVFAVAHVQEAYDALVQVGIRFDQAPHSLNAEAWAANFHDPDGHRLSVYGPR